MSPTTECGKGVGQPLCSARLRLRPMVSQDAAVLADMAYDWDVTRYTTLPFPYDLSNAETLIEHSREGVLLVLERLLDREIVGCIVAHPDGSGGHEVSYWLGRAHWGHGYATEAARRFFRHLFVDRNFSTLWTTVNPDNVASVHVIAHLGMVQQGKTLVHFPGQPQPVALPKYVLGRNGWQAAHANRPKLLVAAAALIDGDGRVLMTTRPHGKSMAGLWEFPGGKVHADETPEQALRRELAEELGVDTAEGCMAAIAFASHDYDAFHLLMPLYAIRVWQGNPVAQEGQELKWLKPSQILDMPMPPADIPLVAMLREWV